MLRHNEVKVLAARSRGKIWFELTSGDGGRRSHRRAREGPRRLPRNGKGKEAKLGYRASVAIYNRPGMVVRTVAGPADPRSLAQFHFHIT